MRVRAPLRGIAAAVIWLVPTIDIVALVLLGWLAPRDPDPVFFVTFALWIASFGYIGGLVAIRVPGNPVGWLLWASATLVAFGLGGSDYAGYGVEHLGAPLPLAVPVAWVASWSFVVAIGLTLVIIPLLFPDGRLPSRRWRLIAGFGAVAILSAASVAFRPGPLSNVQAIENPLGVPALGPFIDTLGFPPAPLLLIAILLALTAPIARFRIGIGIAILRYRLYEIDRIVSRTVAYALITAILAAVFAGAVLVLQALVAPLESSNSLAVVASTLLVAALFQPVRRRVQGATDRRFNRSRYDAAETVAGLAERLRGQVDLAGLSTDVVRVAATAFEPTRAALWLRDRPTE
jgi:hypothetical protein